MQAIFLNVSIVIRATKGTNPLCSCADAALLNQAEQK